MSIHRELHVAVVDDDREVREQVTDALGRYGAEYGCRMRTESYPSAEDFLAANAPGRFDIVLLDIFLEGMDGTACGHKIRETDPSCILIFLTSSREHMPEAFACHAFGYLSKPLDTEKLSLALKDALRVLPRRRPMVELSTTRQNVQVCLDDICSIVSDAHYLLVSLRDGQSHRVRLKLDRFLEMTGSDPRFLRINRGVAVNIDQITGTNNGRCLLADGSSLPMRTRDRRSMEEAIRRYHFDAMRAAQRET